MSNNAPSGDSPTRRLTKFRSAAEKIEPLAAEYHSAIRPVREAVQAVADVPLEDRDRWAAAVSALAARLSENGMADVPASLETAPRWGIKFEGSEPGHALAGEAVCAALATAIADGCPPIGFFAALDQHAFITTLTATQAVCDVLSELLYEHVKRTAPEYTTRYHAVLTEAGTDSRTLRDRLAQCRRPLSSEADGAICDWDECSSGHHSYKVSIHPTTDRATVNDKAEESEGGPPQAESATADTETRLVLPDPLPDDANPFRVIGRILFTANDAACHLTDARRARVDQLGRKMRTEDRDGVLMLHWEDDVDRQAVKSELFRSIVNPWWKAHSDARQLCAAHGIPFNVYDPLLKAAWGNLNEFWSIIRGVASDKEVYHDLEINRRLHELADSTTPAITPAVNPHIRHATEEGKGEEPPADAPAHRDAARRRGETTADKVAARPTRDPNKPGRDRQNDILAAIRVAGTPLTRPEIIDAMRLTTEGKMGANLAWMVTNHILIKIAQQGYWPAGEPEPK